MLTPTLITALIHSAWSEKAERTEGDLIQLAHLLEKWVEEHGWKDNGFIDSPVIPIVGQFNTPVYADSLTRGVDIEELLLDGQYFIWGRARLGRIVRLFVLMNELEQRGSSPGLVDLGTPLEPLAGPSNAATQDLVSILKQHPVTTSDAAIVILDNGVPSQGSFPETFNGRLDHLVTQDMVMSDHAIHVLSLLVDGLLQGGGLQHCSLVCGLVTPPGGMLNGLPSFARTNSVDLLSVLKIAQQEIPNRYPNLPIVLNISLGTHGGPHNGDAPLEAAVSAICRSLGECYIHCAAGNDGSKAVHTTVDVTVDRPKLVKLTLRQQACKEFMIEFWCTDAGSPLTLKVAKNKKLQSDFILDGRTAFQIYTPDVTTATMHRWRGSIVQNKAYSGMRSLSFGLSSPQAGILDGQHFEMELECNAKTQVHVWTAVCEDSDAILYGGTGIAGNIRVPATARDVICVSGIDEYGRWWTGSSEGPLPRYGGSAPPDAPHVAHRVTCSYAPASSGTSFAAPRVAAATAQWLLKRGGVGQRLDAKTLVGQLIGKSVGSWDPYIGWGTF